MKIVFMSRPAGMSGPSSGVFVSRPSCLMVRDVSDVPQSILTVAVREAVSELARAVIDGDMTLGMMTAMQYIIGQLNAPISQFIGFVQEAQDAKISLERLGEIQERGDEEDTEKDYIREIPRGADIEFRDVTFQYNGPHSEKVLDGVSVTIPHDRVTAIVGASGSGKTTMVKMMLGFYDSEAERYICHLHLIDAGLVKVVTYETSDGREKVRTYTPTDSEMFDRLYEYLDDMAA